jgi:hypothetical protein
MLASASASTSVSVSDGETERGRGKESGGGYALGFLIGCHPVASLVAFFRTKSLLQETPHVNGYGM